MTMLPFFKTALKSFKPDGNNEALIDCEKIQNSSKSFFIIPLESAG